MDEFRTIGRAFKKKSKDCEDYFNIWIDPIWLDKLVSFKKIYLFKNKHKDSYCLKAPVYIQKEMELEEKLSDKELEELGYDTDLPF